jgi:hypothetical protein
MIHYYLADVSQSIQQLNELVLPVVQRATDWSSRVAFGLISLHLIWGLIMRFIKDL